MGKKSVTHKNKKQEIQNKKQEIQNKKQETRNKKKKVAQNYRGGAPQQYATITSYRDPEDSEDADFLTLKEGLLSIGLGMVVVGLSVYLAK
jgi:uncharacterized membrane-anchored protein